MGKKQKNKRLNSKKEQRKRSSSLLKGGVPLSLLTADGRVSVESGCWTDCGQRAANEDRSSCGCCPQSPWEFGFDDSDDEDSGELDENCLFFAVFDGHGGAKSAEYLRRALRRQIGRHLAAEGGEGGGELHESMSTVSSNLSAFSAGQNKRVKAALRAAHLRTEVRLWAALGGNVCEGPGPLCAAESACFAPCATEPYPRDHSGSTSASVVLMADSMTVYAANVGDSRMVMCRHGSAVPLSIDQTPMCKLELKRLQSRGIKVDKQNRVDGILSVSRAFGDFELKSERPLQTAALAPSPEIRRIQLVDGDRFLILASDGVFDVLSNQDAVDCVLQELKSAPSRARALAPLRPGRARSNAVANSRRHTLKQGKSRVRQPPEPGSAAACAKALCDQALLNGTNDNCTAVVVVFHYK